MAGSIERLEQGKLSDICDLFNKYGSDKDRNGYLQVYHCLFNKLCDESLIILTIGSSDASLLALQDYFINGKIVNIGKVRFLQNLTPRTQMVLGTEIPGDFQEPRIECHECNSTKKNEVADLMAKIDNKFDIIIDYNSGDDKNRISTLRNLYNYLKDDGTYIIEELNTESKLIQCPSLVGCLCNHDSYFFAGIKSNMCVIQKHHLNSKRKIY